MRIDAPLRTITVLCLAAASACAARVAPPPTPDESCPSPMVRGERPRYDLEGSRLVFSAGPPGAHRIHVQELETGTVQQLPGQGDDVEPAWTPDGKIAFASNRDGDYDLWLIDPAATKGSQRAERLTDLAGDEREPTVAPIPFGFYAVQHGICGSPASGVLIAAYHKVLFTRKHEGTSEIWFSSIAPVKLPAGLDPPKKPMEDYLRHGVHQGRITPPGKSCAEPYFAPDGLAAVWTCDGAIEDADAVFAQSFETAIKALKSKPPEGCAGWEVDLPACLAKLERQYATYPGRPVSTPAEALVGPSISANQIELLADADGRPMHRARFDVHASWKPLPLAEKVGRALAWSPRGTEVAYEVGGEIRREPTHFYLQTVRNLRHFPELYGEGQSELMAKNGFLVRPAQHKEFYVLHDQLRYAEKPQFITVDVVLQAFRDEFLRMLEGAEQQAATSVHLLSGALMQHYLQQLRVAGAPGGERARYLAVLFATAWAPLEAAATMERLSDDERNEALWTDPDSKLAKKAAQLSRPVAVRLPEELPRIYRKLPPTIRDAVRQNLERMLAHAGIAKMQVPGLPEPLPVDFSQFQLRGAYAENQLAAYFLAMNWLGAMPLPIDSSLRELVSTMEELKISGESLTKRWRKVDGIVGAFMGRPVDATLEHVALEVAASPSISDAELKRRLLERRGPVPIRDATGKERELMVTVFPKRVGLDVTFFRKLTHPDVFGRGLPSSLDVFAALGNRQATEHATRAAGDYAGQYSRVLSALKASAETRPARPAQGKAPGQQSAGEPPKPARSASDGYYASTDLYHSWLSLLVTLATPLALPDPEALRFAQTTAWQDRQLYSALAGYAQLKHSAVLYAMQDMSAECDGETSYHLALEQPAMPRPVGFVEPNVPFYDALSELARRSYELLLGDPEGPNALLYPGEEESRLNAMNFASDLAAIARAELTRNPLTKEQALLIEYIGAKLEPLTLGPVLVGQSRSIGGEGREQRGVALVTDIHTNWQRQQALAIGVGRIFDLWAIVPGEVGDQLTQGGILSFYEFLVPMNERPTDATWSQRADAKTLPPLPPWTASFIETR